MQSFWTPPKDLSVAALALAGCSTAPQSEYNPSVEIKSVDAPQPQNLQEKPVDLTAQSGNARGGMQSMEAQGDISQLLNQIHTEQDPPKKSAVLFLCVTLLPPSAGAAKHTKIGNKSGWKRKSLRLFDFFRLKCVMRQGARV